MSKIPDIYGSMVFNEHTMQERLPSATYKSLLKTIKKGEPLDIEVANVVAHAMKEWAIEKGATHYTHWFQPLSGITVREARQLPRSRRRRPRHHELLRQGAHPGRARRLQLPVRRPSRHLRSPRLHGMGPHLLRVHQGRGAVHPHRVLQLHRRGARQEDAAAALHGAPSTSSRTACWRCSASTSTSASITTVGAEQEYFLISREGLREARRTSSCAGRTLFGYCPAARARSWRSTTSAPSAPRSNEFMKELD